jgi:hypothetical protein
MHLRQYNIFYSVSFSVILCFVFVSSHHCGDLKSGCFFDKRVRFFFSVTLPQPNIPQRTVAVSLFMGHRIF